MRGGDGTDTPVELAAEDLLFVIGSRHRLYGVTVDVGRLATEILALLERVVCINLRLNCGDLALCIGALLKFRHLLSLHRRCDNFLTEDNVTNLINR